jgi:GNAT superfamily N-acetyltransferase
VTGAGSARRLRAGRRMSRRPPPMYRPAGPDDLPAAARVWSAALADYLGRLNQPTIEPDLEPIRRLLAHLLATDPSRFWVATRQPDERPAPGDVGMAGERVVGFASANVRGDLWFLAMLFVDPAEQAAGIGRALLDRVRDGADGLALGTATDSAQPISNALYARLGIVPRVPVLHLVGRVVGQPGLPDLRPGVRAVPFERLDASDVARAVDALDERLLGYARRPDHTWLAVDGRLGIAFREDGRTVGYGYASRVGRVGPVAAAEPDDLARFVGHILRAVPAAGAHSLWVPGSATDTVVALLGAGFELEPFPALLCWSRPFAPFDRYLPISLALI